MYQAGDVRVENVPDAVLHEPTDVIVRVTSACICGSDLWPYQSMPANEQGRRMGHEFIGMGRHQDRTDLGREFGATDVVAERGEEGVERVLELTRGDGTHAVLECVGTLPSIETAVKIVRAGGAISRIGVPQYTEGPLGFDTVFRNVTFTGGAAPARAYIEELMPRILDGTVEPGRVFDRTVGLDEVPDGYKAIAERESLKVLIRP